MAYPAHRQSEEGFLARAVDRALVWMWKQVSYRPNRRLVVVFLLYLANILTFAKAYDSLYRHSINSVPNPHFVFSGDILRTRNQQARAALSEELATARLRARILSELQDVLAKLSSAPKPKPLGTFEYVEFEVSGYQCEFDLMFHWSHTADQKLVMRNGLIIEDKTGRRLLNREVAILGPKDHEPRPPDVQRWIDLEVSGEDINLYRQMATISLQDTLKEVTEFETALKSASDETPRFWSFWDFVYFSTITQTTVGYGDILPNSTAVRMLVSSQVLIGLVLVGFALTFAFRPSTPAT
jgi:hypothetical protein